MAILPACVTQDKGLNLCRPQSPHENNLPNKTVGKIKFKDIGLAIVQIIMFIKIIAVIITIIFMTISSSVSSLDLIPS